MKIDTWWPFLKRWSEEWFPIHAMVPRSAFEEPVMAGRLGFGPGSEEDLDAAETRLGCALPPSLRAFLPVADGRRTAGGLV